MFMKDTSAWILTFNRPHALNRLIEAFGRQGMKVNVFSNHPKLEILNSNRDYVDEIVVNSLNSTISNSWCARSWNSIMIRAWHRASNLILIQDDTYIMDGYVEWQAEQAKYYDFMWGPGGDQWHYLSYEAFQKIGYWDERYIGCYCGDADYLKRAFFALHPEQISVEERHNWGFMHNPSGIQQYINTEYNVKTIDPTYENQHWQLEGGNFPGQMGTNPTILRSQRHFMEKWGVELDNGKPVIDTNTRKMREIDWYPWFTKIHNVHIEETTV
jgi:hypothetical protein